MPDWNDISERFAKLLTELDAEPIQAEAEKPFRLALVGRRTEDHVACAFAERVPSERISSNGKFLQTSSCSVDEDVLADHSLSF